MYERVHLKKCLLCGSNLYRDGVYTAPIPEDILREVRMGTGLVDVIEMSARPVTTIIDTPSLEKKEKSTTSSVTRSKNKVNEDLVVAKKEEPKEEAPVEKPVKRKKVRKKKVKKVIEESPKKAEEETPVVSVPKLAKRRVRGK